MHSTLDRLTLVVLALAMMLSGCNARDAGANSGPDEDAGPIDPTQPAVMLALQYRVGMSRTFYKEGVPSWPVMAIVWSDGLAAWSDWDPSGGTIPERDEVRFGRMNQADLNRFLAEAKRLREEAGAADGLNLWPPDSAHIQMHWRNEPSSRLNEMAWAHVGDGDDNPYVTDPDLPTLDNELLGLLRAYEWSSKESAAAEIERRLENAVPGRSRADWWRWARE